MNTSSILRHLKSFFHGSRPGGTNRPDGIRSSAKLFTEELEDRMAPSVDLSLAWVQTFGGPSSEWGPAIVRDAAGDTYVAGTKDAGGWYGTFYVRKYDSGQALQWEQTFGQGSGTGLAIDANQNLVVVGPRVVSGVEGMFAAKLNPAGQVLWSNQLTSSGPSTPAYDVALDNSGAVYVSGAWGNFMKLDGALGTIQWQRYVGEAVNSVAVSSLGSVYVAGYAASGSQAFLANYSADGTQNWYKAWGGSGYEQIASIACDSADNIVLVTNFSGHAPLDPTGVSGWIDSLNGSGDVAVSKLDSQGNYLWGSQENVIGGPDTDYSSSGVAVAIDPAGRIYVMVSSRTAVGPEDFNGLPTVFAPTGGPAIWTGVLGTTDQTRSDTRAQSVVVDSQFNVYIAGTFTATTDLDPNATSYIVTSNAGSWDAYFLKLRQTAPTIDTTPPVTVATPSGAMGGNGRYTTAVSVTLFATDPDDPSTDLKTIYSVNGAIPQTYATPFTVSGNGPHVVTYFSTDPAGNVEASRSLNFTIDTSAPVTTATPSGTQAGNGDYTSPVTIVLSATDDDDPTNLLVTKYAVDGGEPQVYSGAFTVSANGTHSVTYFSTDPAGNTEAENTLSFVIASNHPPVANSFNVSVTNSIVLIDVLAHASDPDQDALSIVGVTQGAQGNVVVTNGKVVYTVTKLFAVTDSFTYTVSDGHGHTATATVTVNLQLPPTQELNLIQSQIQNLNLSTGVTTSLNNDLQNADKQLSKGNGQAALSHLRNFETHVRNAQKQGKIDAATADLLVHEVHLIVEQLI